MSSDDVCDESIHGDHLEHVDDPAQKKLQELESLRETIAWKSKRKRRKFIRQLCPLIDNWNSGLPELRDVFRREEMECLLADAVYCMGGKQNYRQGARFIEFVARAGYKDEPELDKDGEPVSNRTTALHHASLRRFPNKIVLLRELFKIYDRLDVNYTDKFDRTHFYVACEHGFVDIVEKFLELGQDANYLGPRTKDSPLHLALKHNHRDMVELLLRRRVDPNVIGNCGETPLHIVARRFFDVDFAREFFEIYDNTEQKLLVDVCNEFGLTPLHLALVHENRQMVGFLLRRGADPNLTSKNGSTPLHTICVTMNYDDDFRHEFFEIVHNELGSAVELDAVVDRRGDTALHKALFRRRIDSFEFLLSRGASPNAANNDYGHTALHVICNGDYEEMELLRRLFELSRPQVEIDARDRFGNTPLHLAARSHHRRSVEWLLGRGADPSLVNEAGWTLLHQVCWWHRDDVGLLKTLLELRDEKDRPVLRVDARATAEPRNTALHVALQHGHSDNRGMAELLLRRGADPNAANADGSTPLHFICRRRRDDDLLKFFCEISEEVNDRAVRIDVRDKEGRTPLEEAMANTLPRAVDFLLNQGAHLPGSVFRPFFDLSALSYFDRELVPRLDEEYHDFKLRLASGTMMVLERFENVGYELDRSDALKIMAFLSRHGLLLDTSQEDWYDDKRFVYDAKRIIVEPSLSLYDLTRLPAREAEKRLTLAGYLELAQSGKLNKLRQRHLDLCARHLCEKLSRRFFLDWALEPLMELIHCRLPILCCEMINEKLTNKDLWSICLAATEQNS